MASNLTVPADCISAFDDVKFHRSLLFVVYKIDPCTSTAVLETQGSLTDKEHTDFTAALPDNECRYPFYYFAFYPREGMGRVKFYFINWTPDGAEIRNRMMYTAKKASFEAAFSGSWQAFSATEKNELEPKVLEQEL